MLELVTTGQFRKDFKRVKKRGYDMKLLEDVIDLLLNEHLIYYFPLSRLFFSLLL